MPSESQRSLLDPFGKPRCSGCDVHPCIGCRGLLVYLDPFDNLRDCPDCVESWPEYVNGPCGTGTMVLREVPVHV